MNIQIPMNASFSIASISVTESLDIEEETPCSERIYNLVLRLERSAGIRLSSGEDLKDLDVHFGLSSKWAKPESLGLQPQDVGFLTHIRESSSMSFEELTLENSIPFIHGAAIWPSNILPDALFQPAVEGFVNMTLSSVSEVLDEEPFIWSCNQEHTIYISSVSVSAVQRNQEDNN